MTDRDIETTLSHIDAILSAADAALTAERAAAIDAALAPAATDAALAARLHERLDAAPADGADDGAARAARAYAAASAAAHAGKLDAARAGFHDLVAALEQAAEWEGFVAAAARGLALVGAPDFARALARAWEKAGPQSVTASQLEAAAAAAPDDHRLAWATGFALERAGRSDEGRRYVAASLAAFIHKRDLARAEEGFLHLLESKDRDVQEALLSALVLLTRQEGPDAAAAFWELAGDLLDVPGVDAKAWEFFRDHLSRHPDHERLRPAALRALRGVARDRGLAEEALAATGLGGTLLPVPVAIARVENLFAWPPGLFVDHKYNGIGKVLANDGETLRIQFPARVGDLSIDIAKRSLLKLDPRDLKVRLVWDSDAIAREIAGDPVGVVHTALVTLGGEGTKEDVKRVLVPQAVAVDGWNAFWRVASKAMQGDARIDLSQLARRIYRVAEPGAPPGEGLPEFDVKARLTKRVETLERFLDENVEKGAAVAGAHAETIARLCAKEPASSDGRLGAMLLLNRLALVDDEAARAAIAAYFAEADEFPASIGKAVQARCLALSSAMADPTGVYLATLASRTKALRDEALDRLAAHFAEEYLAWLLRLLRKSPDRASAILHVVTRKEVVEGWPAWDALLALARIAAAPPRPTHQKQALEEIEGNESLRRGLRDAEPEPETAETLRLELTTWRASERLLVPILDALDGVGRAAFADAVRDGRRGGKGVGAATAPSHPRLADHADRILMTAAAFARLKDEVHRVGTELKTSIPKAIETARAHGDLRENAEYEAAKEKQRRFAARLTELEEKLNRAKILDASVAAAGVAGPGTEVTIEDAQTGAREALWILGEGDDLHGEHVISYMAPLGKLLAGRREGDEVAIARGGAERRYRVASVVVRVPA
jgi:transcription elongation factor GreA